MKPGKKNDMEKVIEKVLTNHGIPDDGLPSSSAEFKKCLVDAMAAYGHLLIDEIKDTIIL